MKRGAGQSWSALTSPGGREVVGELRAHGVEVCSSDDVEHLWLNGCYGKGLLSRSRAERLQKGRQKREGRPVAPDHPYHGIGPLRPLPEVLGAGQRTEPCHLMPEETIYLMHVEHCLRLRPPLHITDVWNKFSALHPRFQLLFFAYHHYRQLGWIVRGGSKMGVDLVLYQDHPGREHATHSVIVQETSQHMSWPELLGIGRVSENVRKTLVLCRVEFVSGTLDQVLARSTIVDELVYRRWATNRTRDGAYGEEADWSDD